MLWNLNIEVVFSIVAYSLCSGTLVWLNHQTYPHVPFPSLITCVQMLVTLTVLFLIGIASSSSTKSLPGMLNRMKRFFAVDPMQWHCLIPYSYYALALAWSVYHHQKSIAFGSNAFSNNDNQQHNNSNNVISLETLLIVQAVSTCGVALLDVVWLGREYPSTQSWTALALMVVGAADYGHHSHATFSTNTKGLAVAAVFGPFLYLLSISLEMAYGKSLLNRVKLKIPSGPVWYSNLLALPPMLFLAAWTGEIKSSTQSFASWQQSSYSSEQAADPPSNPPDDAANPITNTSLEAVLNAKVLVFVALGCIAWTGLSYSTWWCRGKVSATSFAVVAVLNQCWTVWFLNGPAGGAAASTPTSQTSDATHNNMASLFLCLLGALLYRQAPLRKSKGWFQEGDGGSGGASRRSSLGAADDDVWETELTLDEKIAVKDEEDLLLLSSPYYNNNQHHISNGSSSNLLHSGHPNNHSASSSSVTSSTTSHKKRRGSNGSAPSFLLHKV